MEGFFISRYEGFLLSFFYNEKCCKCIAKLVGGFSSNEKNRLTTIMVESLKNVSLSFSSSNTKQTGIQWKTVCTPFSCINKCVSSP